MTHISTNSWDESISSSTVCIILPMTTTSYIEYLINGIFNNSLKNYVLVFTQSQPQLALLAHFSTTF